MPKELHSSTVGTHNRVLRDVLILTVCLAVLATALVSTAHVVATVLTAAAGAFLTSP